MKTLNQLPLILMLFFFFISVSVFGSGNKDTSYVIEIDGKVLIPSDDDSKTYKIELLCHNTVVDSGMVVDSESFLLKVKKNSWYTIRIKKEGYLPMSVSINTKLPDNNKEFHTFHFDTELIPGNRYIMDTDAIDFPIAIVSFDKKSDAFVPVIEYSKNIRRSLFDPQSVKEGYAKLDR